MSVGRGTGAWGLWRLYKGVLVGMQVGEPRSPSAGARGFSEQRGDAIVILWVRVWRSPVNGMRCADIRFELDLGKSLLGNVLLWIYVNHELWTPSLSQEGNIMQGYLEHSKIHGMNSCHFPCTVISESQIIAHGSQKRSSSNLRRPLACSAFE